MTKAILVSLTNNSGFGGTISSSFLGPDGQLDDNALAANTQLPTATVLFDTARVWGTSQLYLQITFGTGTNGDPFRIVSAQLDAERVPVMTLPDRFGEDDYDEEIDGGPEETGEDWLVSARGDATFAAQGLNVSGSWDEENGAVFYIG